MTALEVFFIGLLVAATLTIGWFAVLRRLPALQGPALTSRPDRLGGLLCRSSCPTPRVSLLRSTRWPGWSARWRGDGRRRLPRHRRGDVLAGGRRSTSDGGPYLSYTSTIRLVTAPADTAALEVAPDEARPAPVWQTESGYWRIPPERPTDWGLTDDQHPVELLVADPSGHVALYIGAVGKGRIDLVSDAIVRTASGADVSAAQAPLRPGERRAHVGPRHRRVRPPACSPTPPAASRASRHLTDDEA